MKTIRNPKSNIRNRLLYPVILAVPDTIRDLKPKDRVSFLSRHARRALAISAGKSRVTLGELAQDERNAPLPFDGTYWSITHKSEYVAGVVAPSPIGIDIEKMYARAKSLYHKTASEAEWALADRSVTTFFRYWTSKEAVIKAAGTGLKDLLKCRVIRIEDDHHLEIEYETRKWRIEHTYFEDHIASIVQNDFTISWRILPNP
jgi:4'-phosphopantetheinyl transferase